MIVPGEFFVNHDGSINGYGSSRSETRECRGVGWGLVLPLQLVASDEFVHVEDGSGHRDVRSEFDRIDLC